MAHKQSSDNEPTRDWVGGGGMCPPAALPAVRKQGVVIRLFWD